MLDLESFRWKQRLALVFGPSSDDAIVTEQRRVMEQHADGTDERELLVGYIFKDGQSTLGGEALSAKDATALRERFGVASGSFAFVLIGKDGGVKRHATEPVATDDLFEQIDAMPMRQREMQEQRGD